jgi:hypothetical protein
MIPNPHLRQGIAPKTASPNLNAATSAPTGSTTPEKSMSNVTGNASGIIYCNTRPESSSRSGSAPWHVWVQAENPRAWKGVFLEMFVLLFAGLGLLATMKKRLISRELRRITGRSVDASRPGGAGVRADHSIK